MTGPLVTIGLAAYNAAGTVEWAVRSTLAQTWRPTELVAVDDCSDDTTFEVLKQLAARHPQIRVFRNGTNGGVAVTRNRILEEARGEFVAFFDDDDESTPDRVASQLARILDYERDFAGGAPVICHAARRLLYPDGTARSAATMGETEGRRAPSGIDVAKRILLGTPLADGYGACPTCSQMARLSTYRSLGGFDPAFRRGEDTDLNIRLAMAGGHFVGVGRPLVTQVMTKTSEKSLADEYRYSLLLAEKHRDLIDRYSDSGFIRQWIDFKQAWLEGRRALSLRRLATLMVSRPIHTLRRLALSLPHAGLNRAFRRFHTSSPI